MEDNKTTSQTIYSLYNKEENDEDVFKLVDKPGIHIIKKYKDKSIPAERNYRMFISLFFRENNMVGGAVDTVMAKKDDSLPGYPIVSDDQKDWEKNLFVKKYINFMFGYDEDIIFDTNSKKIKYKNQSFTINEFINLLVKNHTGGIFRDMFWKGRISNFLKNYFVLEPVFWLVNANYKKDRINFLLKEDEAFGYHEKEALVNRPKEPFFKYFDIYKNTLLFFALWILTPLFWSSILLSNGYFTITNPFLLFLAFLFFAILEKISDYLFDSIKINKNSFIYKFSKDTLNMKGELMIIK